jgi:hypothetical protein
MTSDEAPIPSANRPGARSAIAAAVCAKRAGPRVYAERMAVPSRSDGAAAAATASGVTPSAPAPSTDHRSV